MKMMLIDGNSILNRAFYAIQMLTNHDNVPTNAIYGFMTTLLKLKEEEQPDHIVVCFDVKEKTFRHKRFDTYKATRKGMPSELAVQLPWLKQVLDAMGIRRVELSGYEADDLLGTISHRLGQAGEHCVIVTGDRDSLQLVNAQTTVRLVSSKQGKTLYECYTPEVFEQKYGIPPQRLIDLKALMGDSADNIAGVPGIGEKTAMQLLHDFGSLEEIYCNLDDPRIKARARTKLIEGEQSARDSFWLATIDCEVPLEISLDALHQGEPDDERLKKILSDLDLRTLVKRLHLEEQSETVVSMPSVEIQPVKQIDEITKQLEAWRTAPAIYAYLGDSLSAICLSDAQKAVFLQSDWFSDEEWSTLLTQIFCTDFPLVMHDAKPILAALLRAGQQPTAILFDTSIASYVLDPTKSDHTLPAVMQRFCDMELSAFDPDDPAVLHSLEGLQAVLAGFGAQIEALCYAHQTLQDKMTALSVTTLFEQIELPLVPVLAQMEVAGCAVESDTLKEFGAMLDSQITVLIQSIYQYAGTPFNINSPKQLGELLFDTLAIADTKPKKTKTGYSTSVEVLERLRDKHPIVPAILEYRRLTKLKSTYVEGLLKVIGSDGRIHTHFQQTVTATGRLSSTEPNLQNIPVRTELGREMRRMFVAPDAEHVLVDADYSQIELRILAHIAQDDHMIAAFRAGQDIHAATAAKVYGVPIEQVTTQMRSSCKAVNFGIVYGISAFSLSSDLGISVKEAEHFIQSYLDTYPGIAAYMEQSKAKAKQQGYAQTLFGRRRPLPELRSSNFAVRSFGERVAMNMPIQGTAADIIKIAMVRVCQRLEQEKLHSRLILQVHDELILEAPIEEKEYVMQLLTEEMEHAFALDAPLVAESKAGHSWYETK